VDAKKQQDFDGVPLEELFQLALDRHLTGQFLDVQRICERVLISDPSHEGSLSLLGLVMLQVGQTQKAVKYLSDAISINHQDPSLHNNLGSALYELALYEQAIKSFNQALDLNPEFSEALYNLG
jgi:Tfp pilus assembly protein PilF